MEPLLRLEHITASYGGPPVLEDLCLQVPEGKILGLVGESGSGKSTAAKVAAGLLAPEKGRILFDGKLLSGRRTKEECRAIQMVFQNPEGSLNPRLTVGKTVADGIRFHGLGDRREAEAKAREILAAMGLPEDCFSRYPSSLSGGQKQRAALARALAVNPRLLIADEPTSSLDVSAQKAMLELLRRLRDERGLSILFISHDLGVIHAVCDEAAVLREGKILETGNTEAFFRSPKTAYAASLLASVPRLRRRIPAAEENQL